MADFEPIAVNTTAEKLEKIANMEINDETLNENSSDNSLPTSKLVYNELKKISENSGGGSNGGLGNLSIWQPNTEYKVGDVVIGNYTDGENNSLGNVIARCILNHTSLNRFENIVYDGIDSFVPGWEVIAHTNALNDALGNRIHNTYATKEELEEALENIQTGEGGVIVVDQSYKPDSKNSQSGKAVAEAVSGVEYFGIETDGTIYLKPEYRGSAIDFKTDSSIVKDLGETVCKNMNDYSKSDKGFGVNGSKINSLPEVLYIPNEVKGTKVTKLAPAMFAYNKRIKQIVLPEGITTIPDECFAYAIHLESVKNVEGVTEIAYGSFFASGIIKIDLPNLGTLGQRAFMKSGHLKRIHLGKITKILDRCFEFCTDLKEITHDSGTEIKTVGNGAFYRTPALKEVDFLSTLTSIGNFAFSFCGLFFDWSTLSGCNFGKYATPLQMNPTLTSDNYEIKTKSCELPAPLRIDQHNPKWSNEDINAFVKYEDGCMYFSIMNAYCGIQGLNYDNPNGLADINKAISITVEEVETMLDVSEMDKTEVYENYYCNIVKYVGATNSNYTQNHYYRVNRSDGVYFWQDIGTKEPTNLDLFMLNQNVKSFDDWIRGLGLKKSEKTIINPTEYPKIIEALQNGSYVVLNVPGSWDIGNGHAIILHGVKSNGEVLFVDSSPVGKNAIGDYTAVTGSCLLQNLTYSANVSENNHYYQGNYFVISENQTKTLLNEKTDQIWSILTEVLKTMDLSILKTYYQPITQTETVDRIIFSVDFEPKIVFFNTTTSKGTLNKNFPTIAEGTVVNGIRNETWIKENISNNQPTMTAQGALQKDGNGTLTNQVSTNLSLSLISVSQNQSTGKWDITIGGKDFSETILNRIIGGEGITYNLFVAG